MRITYDTNFDLLYIRLDDRRQPLLNRRLTEDIVLDIGDNDQIVGIEILDASRRITLEELLPVDDDVVVYEVSPKPV